MKTWVKPKPEHGKMTKYGWMVLHPEKLYLGEFTDIGAFTLIQAECGVTIGDNAQVGSHCAIMSVDSEGGRSGEIRIGKHAKVGSHTSIMPGVVIGDGAVVGAHSFVNQNIPPYAFAYGIPAKIVKENYASDIKGKGGGGSRWVRASG